MHLWYLAFLTEITHLRPIYYSLSDQEEATDARNAIINNFKRAINVHARLLFQCIEDCSMRLILKLTSAHTSTDPRDRVYALCGLSRSMNCIRPDYKRSIGDLYATVVKNIILSTENESLAELRLIRQTKERYLESYFSETPSWVPDYHRSAYVLEPRFDEIYEDSWESLYNSCGNEHVDKTLINLEDDEKLSILRLTGVKVDVVKSWEAADHPRATIEDFRTMPALVKFLKRVARVSDTALYPITGETRCVAFWRTILADQISYAKIQAIKFWVANSCSKIRPRTMDDYVDSFHKKRRLRRDDVCIPPTTQEEEEALFRARHVTLQDGIIYQFRITEKGYMGILPAFTYPGDWICILRGGTVPFVLRQLHDGYWMLVGECYLHGFMDGEILEEKKAGRVRFEVFALK